VSWRASGRLNWAKEVAAGISFAEGPSSFFSGAAFNCDFEDFFCSVRGFLGPVLGSSTLVSCILRFFDVEEEEEGIGAFVMFGGFCCVGWFVVGWKEAEDEEKIVEKVPRLALGRTFNFKP
jgi:hypothetical protein